MASRPGRAPESVAPTTPRLPWNGHSDLAQGFLGNVLNPKAAAVYLTVAPQFLHAGSPLLPQTLELCAAHLIVVSGWLLTWTMVMNLSRRTFRSPTFRRIMDRIAAVFLVAFGLCTGLATR